MSKVKAKAPIELGGKPRHLLLNLNSMCAFEEATGRSMLNMDTSSMGVVEFRALLWACLLHEDENLTLKEVGSWVRIDNMDSISKQLNEAWIVAMPEPEKDAAPLVENLPTG